MVMTEWGGFTRKEEGGKLELSAECRLLRYVTAAFRVILNNNSRVILLTNHVLFLLFWWRLWRTKRWRREQKFHNSSTMLRLNIELCFISLSTVFLWFSAIVVLSNGVTWNFVLILLFKLPYNQLFGLVVGSVGFLAPFSSVVFQ